MKRIALILVIFCLGCATTQKNESIPDLPPTPQDQAQLTKDEVKEPESVVEQVLTQPDATPELQNIDDEELQEYFQEKGVVFAKTDFQGVLKASYVRLLIQNRENEADQFQLHIGKEQGQTKFPWDVKTVEPGYFFIELPAGEYRVSSISIPVGTTMATEDINVVFDVPANQITYIGTLKVNGTKEKIRLGGVPVIKPGFEYEMEVLDETEEGIAAFRERYPNIINDINVQLMQ